MSITLYEHFPSSYSFNNLMPTNAHLWCDGHSTSKNTCEVWGKGPRFKSLGESFTHIYTQIRLEQKFYIVSKKKLMPRWHIFSLQALSFSVYSNIKDPAFFIIIDIVCCYQSNIAINLGNVVLTLLLLKKKSSHTSLLQDLFVK